MKLSSSTCRTTAPRENAVSFGLFWSWRVRSKTRWELLTRIGSRLGTAGCADGNKDRSADQRPGTGEQRETDAVDEGVCRVVDEVRRAESLSDSLRRAERAARVIGQPRRKRRGVLFDSAAVGAVENAPEHCDPESASELARDVVDRRGHALFLARQRGDDRGRCGRAGQSHACTEGEQSGKEVEVR